MKSTFGIRLKQFIEYLGVSVRQFEIECGIGTGAIGKVINHGTDLSKETLDKIGGKYPELNMNWLLADEGDMLNKSSFQELKQVVDKYHPRSGTKESIPIEVLLEQSEAEKAFWKQKYIDELKKNGSE